MLALDQFQHQHQNQNQRQFKPLHHQFVHQVLNMMDMSVSISMNARTITVVVMLCASIYTVTSNVMKVMIKKDHFAIITQ